MNGTSLLNLVPSFCILWCAFGKNCGCLPSINCLYWKDDTGCKDAIHHYECMLVVLPINCNLLLSDFIPCLIGLWYDLNICLVAVDLQSHQYSIITNGFCLMQEWLFALLLCIVWNLLSCLCWMEHGPVVTMKVWSHKWLRALKETAIFCYSSKDFWCISLDHGDHSSLNIC